MKPKHHVFRVSLGAIVLATLGACAAPVDGTARDESAQETKSEAVAQTNQAQIAGTDSFAGWNIPGLDIEPNGYSLPWNATVDDCAARCRDNSSCVAYTYRNPNFEGDPNPRCWLKWGFSNWEQNSPNSSGVFYKRPFEHNVDFPGGYFSDWDGQSVDYCRTVCVNTAQCTAFTYRFSDLHCWLKGDGHGAASLNGIGQGPHWVGAPDNLVEDIWSGERGINF
jgi:hypothetical protein